MPEKRQDYGGNAIGVFEAFADGLHCLADSPYKYYALKLAAGAEHRVEGLGSVTAYVHEITGETLVDGARPLALHEVVLAENSSVAFQCRSGAAVILFAGVDESSAEPSLTVVAEGEVKRVSKPWGHELWLNGEHPGYAFKQIYVKAGTKTSLQYHRYKRETNVLVDGTARLHYRKTDAELDEVAAGDIGTGDLQPISTIDVHPLTLHRLEALTDILLFEVSTPHLDDVIRVSDDTERADGRISSEH